ncbi:MAG: hypothetical protein Q6373_005405 [Candidatus Sigynarchaeota archaeon]
MPFSRPRYTLLASRRRSTTRSGMYWSSGAVPIGKDLYRQKIMKAHPPEIALPDHEVGARLGVQIQVGIAARSGKIY